MGRKTLIITDQFPYHIVARANNKEWFYLPIEDCWEIFREHLWDVNNRFQFRTHAFILMSNHYHLIGTCCEKFPLPKVMEWFQRAVNRTINARAGRINHVFGGPYRACLIPNEVSYLRVLTYVYRNPVRAQLVQNVENYRYSTLVDDRFPETAPTTGIAELVPRDLRARLDLFNRGFDRDLESEIRKAIKKTEFKIASRIPVHLKNITC